MNIPSQVMRTLIMNFEPKNHIVSIERIKSVDNTMVTHVIVLKNSILSSMAPTVKIRIMKDRNTKKWNMFFHEMKDEPSDIFGDDCHEIKSSKCITDNDGTLRELLKDIDDGVFS